ncbi:hypothetical protein IFM89_006045 [Coptis chinensis]|uniref:Transposase-associated domain-containing protein n=1 Tax=Coptis chinensis TaxID=261450 RepID=A0A835I178_9MAGN|nr:hypothetical protein IFM89_006045 [Coptis chinensis]
MVDISNGDGDWATNMCNDACPYEESDSSDIEINVGEGSTNVSLEDEDESNDHNVSEIEVQEVMNAYLYYIDQVMVDISNEDGDWATNMCNDACPYEESDSSDIEINVGEGSTNVSLEDEDESNDHNVSEIEGFEGQSNEADARSEETNENDFNIFSGKLGGEDVDENAIMFSMRFKINNEAFEFYNKYAKASKTEEASEEFKDFLHSYLMSKEIPSTVEENLQVPVKEPSDTHKDATHLELIRDPPQVHVVLLLRRILIKGKEDLELAGASRNNVGEKRHLLSLDNTWSNMVCLLVIQLADKTTRSPPKNPTKEEREMGIGRFYKEWDPHKYPTREHEANLDDLGFGAVTSTTPSLLPPPSSLLPSSLVLRYILGCEKFIEFAWNNRVEELSGEIYCPCVRCLNLLLWPKNVVEHHIKNRGILRSYVCWTKHGESGQVNTESNEGDDMHAMLQDALGFQNMIPKGNSLLSGFAVNGLTSTNELVVHRDAKPWVPQWITYCEEASGLTVSSAWLLMLDRLMLAVKHYREEERGAVCRFQYRQCNDYTCILTSSYLYTAAHDVRNEYERREVGVSCCCCSSSKMRFSSGFLNGSHTVRRLVDSVSSAWLLMLDRLMFAVKHYREEERGAVCRFRYRQCSDYTCLLTSGSWLGANCLHGVSLCNL